MYAVIKTGGKQYRVEEGQILKVEKLKGDKGAEIQFDDVLMYSNDENIIIGDPIVNGSVVKAHIVQQEKAKKIIVFKYKRRKGYRKTQGHRQNYTAIKIDTIQYN